MSYGKEQARHLPIGCMSDLCLPCLRVSRGTCRQWLLLAVVVIRSGKNSQACDSRPAAAPQAGCYRTSCIVKTAALEQARSAAAAGPTSAGMDLKLHVDPTGARLYTVDIFGVHILHFEASQQALLVAEGLHNLRVPQHLQRKRTVSCLA